MNVKNVMYKKWRNNYVFAVPTNSRQLKALVLYGFCVKSIDTLSLQDLIDFYEDCDWFNEEEYDRDDLLDMFLEDLDYSSSYWIELALEWMEEEEIERDWKGLKARIPIKELF